MKVRKNVLEKMVYTTKDLQIALGIGRETAYSLMRSKAFPSMRIGSRYVVSREALNDWLKIYAGKQFFI